SRCPDHASIEFYPLSLHDALPIYSVRLGLARGLSVGIIPIKSEPTGRGYGRKYLEAELIEGSIVEIPANAKATISVVKSFAAKGRRSSVSRVDPYIVRRVTRNDGAVYL